MIRPSIQSLLGRLSIPMVPRLSALCLFLTFMGLPNCLVDEGKKSPQTYDYVPESPNAQYLAWAQSALAAWNIGLENTDNTSAIRNVTSGYANNPKNWITVANAECDALGLPESIKERCFETSSAIGVCYTRSKRDGLILDTTILVLDTHLSGSGPSTDKLATFIHEVGHCLGLQHWGNADATDSGEEPGAMADFQTHVMYPTSGPANIPHAEEINSIQAVYNTDPAGCGDTNPDDDCVDPRDLPNIDECSQGGVIEIPAVTHGVYETYYPCYYSQVKTSETTFSEKRVHHKNFPYFTISGSIGNAGIRGEMPERGEAIEGEVFERAYIMRSDGTEDHYAGKIEVE